MPRVRTMRKSIAISLTEIEGDEKSGLIDAESAGQARAEIARRLIAASEDSPRNALQLGKRQALILAIFLCLVVPAAAVALYRHAGQPDAPDYPLRARFESTQPDSNILVRRVELRLEEHPEDGRGWEILAPIYLTRGQIPESINAWRNAIKYLGADARPLRKSRRDACRQQQGARGCRGARCLHQDSGTRPRRSPGAVLPRARRCAGRQD